MSDIELAVQLDLALHLGLAATIITLIIWRITDTKNTLNQIQLLPKYIKTGFANSKIVISFGLQWIRLSLKIIAFFLSLLFFFFTFEYIRILEMIVGPGGHALDFFIFNSLWQRSEKLTENTILFCITISILFIFDYIVSILIHVRFKTLTKEEIPKCIHANVIPKNWKASPESMWENRIEEIQDLDSNFFKNALKKRKWLNDWTTWTKCVIGYEIKTSEKIGTENN